MDCRVKPGNDVLRGNASSRDKRGHDVLRGNACDLIVMAGHSRSKNGVLRTPMSRPSTSCGKRDVDARDKRGHDG
jgi:hypothetical protein